MYIILSHTWETLEDIKLHTNKVISIIIVITAILILASMAIGRLLDKNFNLKRPKEVEGYIKGRYVSRSHRIGTILLQIVLIIIPPLFVLLDTSFLEMLHSYVALLFVGLTFEAFMQWKYPVQKNEYKKTICTICILVIVIPILYQFIPADWFAK